ncbi:MAG TPA: hypothetical protein VF188_08380, partial [Longimicrobiales bacterium]
MSDYRIRNQLLLAVPEAVSGVEESPTPAANAVRVRFPMQFTPNLEQLETDYVTGSLSGSAPIVGGGTVSMPFRGFLKGAGTPGVPPDIGVPLRGCGFSETITATPVTGTAAGGSLNTITLDASASSVDNFYKGMPIEIVSGPGAGQGFRVITGYDGSTKEATVYPDWAEAPAGTSEYSIPANTLYRPVSEGLETLTLWQYQHRNTGMSKLRRLKGAAGNFTMRLAPRGLAEIDFTFQGQLVGAPEDVAKPADPVYQLNNPRPFLAAQAFLGGQPVKFSEFTFDLNADVQAFDNPAEAFGFDPYAIANRPQPGGRIVP